LAFPHTHSINWAGAGAAISKNVNLTGDAETNRDSLVQAGQADVFTDIDFLLADLESIYIVSDRDVILETNDGSVPIDFIQLQANKPLDRRRGGYHSNPFSADVTGFFFTNNGAVSANVKIRILSNVTSSSSSSSSA
jgi:hypothetical protein